LAATTQPVNSGQNTGLVVIIVGIFMVIVAFLAVTYLNSDTIRENQDTNSTRSREERADLTQITCAIWQSVGEPKSVDQAMADKILAVCGE